MDVKTFSGEQKLKLTQIINEGMRTLHEIDDLNAGRIVPQHRCQSKDLLNRNIRRQNHSAD